ncbi:OmpW/AlkL family protein [Shimia sediminis]|uniref:OmpW/AlkL family protein n=1 Tax=Shimia sediminis TaxID=2497945 RepID=UPI000F8DA876|nr:OmpW family outer membrane protein [Shimia sediminis]
MRRYTSALALTAALAALSAPALAQSQGDWTVGVGVANVNPKSNNGTLAGGKATISDDTQLSLTVEYFIRDNIGIELLAATPFSHDISINGAFAGETKQLPPTLSLNYHFATASKWKPYVGLGLNYTTFFEEKSPLGTLRLKDSWGVAAQVGLDYQVSDNGALRVNARWMDIDTKAYLDGAYIGKAEIDPVVLGVSYVHRF